MYYIIFDYLLLYIIFLIFLILFIFYIIHIKETFFFHSYENKYRILLKRNYGKIKNEKSIEKITLSYIHLYVCK